MKYYVITKASGFFLDRYTTTGVTTDKEKAEKWVKENSPTVDGDKYFVEEYDEMFEEE